MESQIDSVKARETAMVGQDALVNQTNERSRNTINNLRNKITRKYVNNFCDCAPSGEIRSIMLAVLRGSDNKIGGALKKVWDETTGKNGGKTHPIKHITA
jgi:hypothetical protein